MRSQRWSAIAAVCICASSAAHAQQTINYMYDALGRLVQAQTQGGPESGITQAYHYDAAGNRTQYQVLAAVTLSMNSPAVNLNAGGATLTVNVSDPSATGTVTFTENGTFLGSASVTDGQASVILQGLSKGVYTITASYSGDAAHSPQTTTFTISVQNLNWLPAVLNLLLK